MKRWLYTWLPRFFGCHCRPDRSFFFHGKQLPICARCTGELAGMVLAAGTYWFWHPGFRIYILMLAPLAVDGFVQLLTPYTSNNLRRLWTGILFGYGFLGLVFWTTGLSFTAGLEFGRNLQK